MNEPSIEQEKMFPPPPEGYYRCCACGHLVKIRDGVSYDDQSDCSNSECFGQNFCNKWPGWDVNFKGK